MIVYKRVEVTWEDGSTEVFTGVGAMLAGPNRFAVKQDRQWYIRGGQVKSVKVS